MFNFMLTKKETDAVVKRSILWWRRTCGRPQGSALRLLFGAFWRCCNGQERWEMGRVFSLDRNILVDSLNRRERKKKPTRWQRVGGDSG